MSDPSVRFDPKVIPAEIKRWNWGAFLLNWIWGIGNQTYIALLALVPGFGFIWMLVLGAKGSAWAWRNGRWGQRRAFQARATTVGDMGSHHLARRVRLDWRGRWRRLSPIEAFRSL